MDILSLLLFLAVGALAGWISDNIVKGSGFGLLGNIIVGIVGAVLGGFVFGFFGITTGGWIGSLVMATIGAVILLYLVTLIKKV
jgi:uncharacterized membrane protein YeaQ/YmgE (transglycosylase-associated protein family)